MIDEKEFKKVFGEYYSQIKDFLFNSQWDKEELCKDNEKLKDQTIRVYQRIRALLNIYMQMIVEDRVFDESYLEEYLGDCYSWRKGKR